MARYIPRMPHDDEAIPPGLHLRCTCCGYELTGLVERRCPECGEAFNPRETWLENEQSTWEYHFENVRTRGEYVRMAYVVLAVLLFSGLSLIDRRVLLALPLVAACELWILWSGGGWGLRMICWTICVVWGVVAVWLP